MLQVPGTDILTQARKLSEAPQMAREVIALEMDLPMSEVEVELHIGSIGNVDNVSDTADSIRADRAQAAQLERQALKHSEEWAQSLAHAGVTVRDIGELLGVTFQRAHQLAQPN